LLSVSFAHSISPTMTSLLRALAATLVISTSATLVGAQTPSGTPDNDGWRTVIYPIHGWLPVFGADVRLPEQPSPPGSGGGGGGGITIPSAKTSNNFDGAALAGFRVERWRVSLEGEFLWAGMSGSVELPRFNLDLDTVSYRLMGGFRIAPALYVDGGVRRFAVNMTASILDFPEVTWDPGIWEPVVGVTFRPQLTRSIRLFTQADFGGTGDDANRSASVTGEVEWKVVKHLSLGGGYGLLYLRADGTIQSKPVHFSQTLHGPILSIGLPF
jgi:hypothetical protein